MQSGFPVLAVDWVSGGPVCIRRFELGDVPGLYEATRESEVELRRWMTWCRAGYGIGDALSFVVGAGGEERSGRRHDFAICDWHDGTVLGSIGLSAVDTVQGHANLGYWVRRSRAGHGVATAAVRLAVRFAFTELGLKRVELVIAVGNEASIRVAEKVGAQREGTLGRRLLLGGEWHDAVVYSVTNELASVTARVGSGAWRVNSWPGVGSRG